jgi:hypothetical protein
LLFPLQRLSQQRYQPHRFDTKSGIDRFEPFREQPQEVPGRARWARSANPDGSDMAVHAFKQ